MLKLQLSFKLLSQVPRNLPLPSPLCNNNFVSSLSKTNPKPLFNHSLTQPHTFSHFSSRSWTSHHSLSERFSGFLANPVFLKKVVSNAHLKNQSRGFLDRVYMITQFQRRHFRVHRSNTGYNLNRWRSWFPTSDTTIIGLIVANVGVFMLWRLVDPEFMRKNFMISVENFTSGRVHTVITSAFSHIEVDHIASNMLGLYFFGTTIGKCFGPEFLLKLYLAGALGGSIFYLVHHAFMSPSSQGSGMWYVDPKQVRGLGASGAVNAIMLLNIFLFPTATIYYNFFIPVPAILVGAFLIGTDLLRNTKRDSTISGSAHLGGAFVAALAWARIKKRWI